MSVRPIHVILAAALAAAASRCVHLEAAESSSDEVWLIDTRRAPRTGKVDPRTKQIHYWRLNADNQWLHRHRKCFFSEDPESRPTTIFVHGNDTGPNGAIRSGWPIYRRMLRDAEGAPFRFVIWSWPSQRICKRLRRDLQTKAYYSDTQGYYLADCLRDISPQAPVSLIGFSYGARTITGALHLLAGGSVAGRRLARSADAFDTQRQPKPVRRAILVAAALDADWLLAGRRNGLALSQVDQVLVTCNACDPVLRWYPLMFRGRRPEALGFVGPAGCRRTEKIELLNLSCSLGRSHDWVRYARASALGDRISRYTFLSNSKPTAPPKTLLTPDSAPDSP